MSAGGQGSGPSTGWVTGAGKGLGRALALHLARGGASVAISARSVSDLTTLAEEPLGGRGGLHPHPLDVTNGVATARVVEAIEAERGPLDWAVLNAGTHQPLGLADFSAEGVERLLRVNTLGVAHGLEALLPRMIARGHGRIVVVSSSVAYRGLPTAAAYGASKAAVTSMIESLRPEAEAAGITLQVVHPGFVRTPLTDRNPFPMPFLMEPEVAAARIARGMGGKAFEIAFPRRFLYGLKLARILPYALYFPLIKRFTGIGR